MQRDRTLSQLWLCWRGNSISAQRICLSLIAHKTFSIQVLTPTLSASLRVDAPPRRRVREISSVSFSLGLTPDFLTHRKQSGSASLKLRLRLLLKGQGLRLPTLVGSPVALGITPILFTELVSAQEIKSPFKTRACWMSRVAGVLKIAALEFTK